MRRCRCKRSADEWTTNWRTMVVWSVCTQVNVRCACVRARALMWLMFVILCICYVLNTRIPSSESLENIDNPSASGLLCSLSLSKSKSITCDICTRGSFVFVVTQTHITCVESSVICSTYDSVFDFLSTRRTNVCTVQFRYISFPSTIIIIVYVNRRHRFKITTLPHCTYMSWDYFLLLFGQYKQSQNYRMNSTRSAAVYGVRRCLTKAWNDRQVVSENRYGKGKQMDDFISRRKKCFIYLFVSDFLFSFLLIVSLRWISMATLFNCVFLFRGNNSILCGLAIV